MPNVLVVAHQNWLPGSPTRIRELAEVFARSFERTDVDAIESMIAEEIMRGDHYLVAHLDGRAVGFVSWRKEFEWRHQLIELYHIGRDPQSPVRGIGRQLIAAMEEDAHAILRIHGFRGVWKFFIRVSHRRVLAQNLYRQAGYVHVATLPNYPVPGVNQLQFDKEIPENVGRS